jgi:antitoxin (DNA-binding transcriptional repressor) of toxin-antitoxin stability system
MLIITSREFRNKQGMYLGMAKNGEGIILKSRENGSFKIVPVTEDDTLMSKEDFFAKIDRAREEAREGKGTVIKSKEELSAYFNNL